MRIKRRKTLKALALVLIAVSVAVYLIYGTGWLYGLLYLFLPLLALVGGAYSASVYGLGGAQTKIILFLSAGMASFLIGESIWYVYEQTGQDPFPSVADVFYLLAYPLILIGLVHVIYQAKAQWKKINLSSAILILIAALLFTILTIYFGVFLAYDADSSTLENIVGISYGVADLILIITSILIIGILNEYKNGKFSCPWIYFLVGLVSFLVADVLFAAFTDLYEQDYWLYIGIDILWMVGYAFFSFALFEIGFIIRDVQSKILSKLKRN